MSGVSSEQKEEKALEEKLAKQDFSRFHLQTVENGKRIYLLESLLFYSSALFPALAKRRKQNYCVVCSARKTIKKSNLKDIFS